MLPANLSKNTVDLRIPRIQGNSANVQAVEPGSETQDSIPFILSNDETLLRVKAALLIIMTGQQIYRRHAPSKPVRVSPPPQALSSLSAFLVMVG